MKYYLFKLPHDSFKVSVCTRAYCMVRIKDGRMDVIWIVYVQMPCKDFTSVQTSKYCNYGRPHGRVGMGMNGCVMICVYRTSNRKIFLVLKWFAFHEQWTFFWLLRVSVIMSTWLSYSIHILCILWFVKQCWWIV